MSMKLTKSTQREQEPSFATRVLQVLFDVLLNASFWLAFMAVTGLRPGDHDIGSITIVTAFIILIPLATALIAGLPKIGEWQMSIGILIAAVIIGIQFFHPVDSDLYKEAGEWFRSLLTGPKPETQIDPLGLTLLGAMILIVAVFLADDIRIRRRGIPQLFTVAPFIFFTLKGLKLQINGEDPMFSIKDRITFAAYLVILLASVLFTINREEVTGRKHNKKPDGSRQHVFYMSLMLLLASVLFMAVFLPATRNHDSYDKLQKAQATNAARSAMDKQKKEDASLPQGDLRNNTVPPVKGDVYTVKVSDGDLNETLYLRNFVGYEYNSGGQRWAKSPQTDKGYRQYGKTAYEDGFRPQFMIGQMYDDSNGDADSQDVTITYIVKPESGEPVVSTASAVYPYTASVKGTKDTIKLSSNADYRIFLLTTDSLDKPGDRFKGRTNPSISYKVYEAPFAPGTLEGTSKITAAGTRWSDAVSSYNSYVKDNYLSLDKESEDLLRKIKWSFRSEDPEEVRTQIVKFYQDNGYKKAKSLTDQAFDTKSEQDEQVKTDKKNAKTKEIDNGPISLKDFTEEKEGRPLQFNTLSALMFRAAGYPARYCEGFIVSPNGKKNEQGEYVITYTENFSSWVEVYMNDVGWVPVNTDPDQKIEKVEQKPKEEQEKPDQDEQKKTVPPQPTEQPQPVKKSYTMVWLWIVLTVLLAAALTGLYFLFRRQRAKQLREKILKGTTADNVFKGYRYFHREMKRLGYPASMQEPEKLSGYLDEDYDKYLDLVYRERYAENELNSEERQFCNHYAVETPASMPKLKTEKAPKKHKNRKKKK